MSGLEVGSYLHTVSLKYIVYDHHNSRPVAVQVTSGDLLSIPTGGAGGR